MATKEKKMSSVKQLIQNHDIELVSVAPDTSVFDAAKLMEDKGEAAMLIVENEKLVGIVSERDFARKVLLQERAAKTTKISEIMTSNVITVTLDQNIDDCMALMSSKNIRHLPIIADDKPIGILSILDIVKTQLSEKEFEVQQLESYITGG